MKWFKTANGYTEQEEHTVESIRETAKQDAEMNGYAEMDGYRDAESCFKKEKDSALYRSYLYNFKIGRENNELKGVVSGNGEFYGQFQRKFNETLSELEMTNHHLELEKKAYQNLYMEKRELEAKLYAANRELEMRGYRGKDLT